MPTRIQTLTWLALPNGLTPGPAPRRLRLTAFLCPRLQSTTGRLEAFEEFLPWTKLVRDGRFAVQFGDAPPIDAVAVGERPRDKLWNALFEDDTPVHEFKFLDLSARMIHSYPAKAVEDWIAEKWGGVALESPTELPPDLRPESSEGPERSSLFGKLDAAADAHAGAPSVRDEIIQGGKHSVEGSTATPERQFAQFADFHHPPYMDPPPKGAVPPPPPLPALQRPKPDFHEILPALARYPTLLRWLGLAVDLEVDAPAGGIVTVRVLGPGTGARSPWTAVAYTPDLRFEAKPKDQQEITDRQLPLQDAARFGVVQLDVDGAGWKAIELATALKQQEKERGKEPRLATTGGLPALRSGGLSLVRIDRSVRLADTLAAAPGHEADMGKEPDIQTQTPLFHAEELTRGWRFDIWDDCTDTWRSLHRRRLSLDFTRPHDTVSVEVPDEEGFSQPGATAPPPGAKGEHADLYLHEALARWGGWSLSVEPPSPLLPAEPGDVEEPPSRATDPDFPVEVVATVVPRSLPRLRFGRRYRMRARVVDLAGNSAPVDEAGAEHATAPLAYERYEPVSAPELVLRAETTEGESVERLVIRGNFDLSPNEYAETPEAEEHDYTSPTCERHVAPPKISQLLAEHHGCFDGPDGVGCLPGTKQSFDVALRAQGCFDAVPRDAKPRTRKDGRQEIKAGDTVILSGGGLGIEVIRGEKQLPLPYLPDPFARRAVLSAGRDAGGRAIDAPAPVDFALAWPDAKPFRLVLAAGDGPPVWEDSARVLTIPVPPGETFTFRLSSAFDAVDRGRMGVWRWITAAAIPPVRKKPAPAPPPLPDVLEEVRAAADAGGVWALTPYRVVTLVHALRQPLREPVWCGLTEDRAPGQLDCGLRAHLVVHAPSTASVDLHATWTDTLDDAPDGPRVVEGRATPVQVQLLPHEDDVCLDPKSTQHPARHAFGDTRRRDIVYTPVATTRYREYFHPVITADPARLTRTGPARTLIVPSSARPATPRIVHVLPTFEWERVTAQGDETRSRRRGNGLRVYLDRPWLSSGVGELLGVVLGDSGSNPPYPGPRTGWGRDPAWETAKISDISSSVFERGVGLGDHVDVRVDAAEGGTVLIVPHAVAFDSIRKLWYADIDLEPQASWFPFVRLALARYQPHSVKGCCLSAVVQADFAQLAPDRFLSAMPREWEAHGRPTAWDVALSGPAPTRSSAEAELGSRPDTGGRFELAAGRCVRVEVQRHAFPAEGELGWERISEATVTSSPPEAPLLWAAHVTVPPARAEDTLRLLVIEEEAWLEDNATPGFRPVYVETLPLGASAATGACNAGTARGFLRLALAALAAAPADRDTAERVEKAIDELRDALGSPDWEDDDRLGGEHPHRVFDQAEAAVGSLQRIDEPRPAAVVEAICDVLAAARRIAQTAIDDAIAAGKEDRLDEAREELDKAQEEIDRKDHLDHAVGHFEAAWKDAIRA